MSPVWDDVNARARGLGRHLASEQLLDRLAAAPDLAALARELRAAELAGPEAVDRSPPMLEVAIRRAAGRSFALLLRWLGDRADLVRIVIEDEDRRSLRALFRGAAEGASAEVRLAGLLPTPTLPERLLEELARQHRPRDQAALLAVWGHPYASVVLPAAAGDHPDLLRLGLGIDHRFAERATEGARRGGAALRAFVADTIDADNLLGALALAGRRESDWPVESAFLPGGTRLSRDRFVAAARAPDRARAADIIARAFGDEAIAGVLRARAFELFALEQELLRLRIRRLRDLARRDPLGPAPLLRYFLRLRVQVVNLQLLVWGAALGVPPAVRRERLTRVA
ncbi:MAG TPA: V-type ATPase subunit [Gemmatimonadales bacterium]|nr:V-type ATPase subunit [Gemmatimonadales bacterium]